MSCQSYPFCEAEAAYGDVYCVVCRREVDRILGGGTSSRTMSPRLPPELSDATRVARELWDYFTQTLRTDKVIPRSLPLISVHCEFDDMELPYSSHLVDAVKELVVNRYAVAYRDGVEAVRRERPLPALREGETYRVVGGELRHLAAAPAHVGMGDPFGLIGGQSSMPPGPLSTTCYGCGGANATSKMMCPWCLEEV